jgi:hypothetical protein
MTATLDIDDEVLPAVREIALRRRTSVGRLVSRMLRESLRTGNLNFAYRSGVPLLPRRADGPIVTAELVNRLRDEGE